MVIPLGDIHSLPSPDLRAGDVNPASVNMGQGTAITVLAYAIDPHWPDDQAREIALARMPIAFDADPAFAASVDFWRIDAYQA